jgi:hypothetical protein
MPWADMSTFGSPDNIQGAKIKIYKDKVSSNEHGKEFKIVVRV